MQEHTGKARNARVAVRLTREDQHQVEEAAKTRGYANPSAFIGRRSGTSWMGEPN